MLRPVKKGGQKEKKQGKKQSARQANIRRKEITRAALEVGEEIRPEWLEKMTVKGNKNNSKVTYEEMKKFLDDRWNKNDDVTSREIEELLQQREEGGALVAPKDIPEERPAIALTNQTAEVY